MLKKVQIGFAAAAVLSLSIFHSCSYDEPYDGILGEEYTFVEENLDTKTYLDETALASGTASVKWNSGDLVGAFGTLTKNAKFTATPTARKTYFNGNVIRGDRVRYAYYPYVSNATDYKAVPVTINRNQPYADATSISGNDIKASNKTSTTRGQVSFTFTEMTSFLKVQIDLSSVAGISSDETIESYTITNESGHNITGAYTLNIYQMTMAESECFNNINVTLTKTPAVSAGVATSVAAVAPAFKNGDKVSIAVNTNKHVVNTTLTCSQDFSAGKLYTFKVNSSDCSDISVSEIGAAAAATKRQASWEAGDAFDIAGVSISKENYDLSEVYISENATVDDASLANSIVFVENGATLTLGSYASLKNTVIVCNDPEGTATVTGTAKDSAYDTYVAFYGMTVDCCMKVNAALRFVFYEDCKIQSNVLEGSSTGSVANFFISNSDLTLDADGMSMLDAGEVTTYEYANLIVDGCTIHSSSASTNRNFSILETGSCLHFTYLQLTNNMFLNVYTTDAMVQAGSAGYMDIENNFFYYSASLDRDFVLYEATAAPEEFDCSSNAYYKANGGTGSMHPYSWGTTTGPSALAPSSPLASVDIANGTCEYASLVAASTFEFDGGTKNCMLDRTNKKAYLCHTQSAPDEVEIYAMPGVTFEEGSWSSNAKTVEFTRGSQTESYTYSLPDVFSVSSCKKLSSISGTWTAVWADEFNGNDWDHDVWVRCPAQTSDWNREQYPADESLVVVSDGALVTKAKTASGDEGYMGYKVGGVWGKALKSFDLGQNGSYRIDICARMTDATGYWPAIWMMPDQESYSWPQWGEIDIMEHLNSMSYYYTTYHTYRDGALNQGTYTDYKESNTCNYSDRSTSWHVFSVIVDNDTLYTLFDGKTVLSCKKSDHITSGQSLMNYWPYASTNYYLILDSQVRGGWVGTPSGDYSNVHMDIDYVRYMVKN